MTAVLFTCAGQRADVVTAFRHAGAYAIAADLNPLAPALYCADEQVQPPPVADSQYLPYLAELARAREVGLVVPLTDLDQLALARERERFDALVLLADAATIELTNDKYAAHEFFVRQGIDSPPTWLPDGLPPQPPFPVLVKARRGFGSRHIYVANGWDELRFFLRYTPVDSMVQRVCTGEEFSIDVFCDLEGRCLSAIPRTMIESKGGESIKGMSIKDTALIEIACRVAEALGIVGPANIQCFRTQEGRHQITDVNARFGGAFPLPLAAGGGYPELALALARGEQPQPRLGEFEEGIVMTRFFSQICLRSGPEGRLEAFTDAPRIDSPAGSG